METTEQETAGGSDWGRGCWEMAGAVMYRRATQSAQIALGCAIGRSMSRSRVVGQSWCQVWLWLAHVRLPLQCRRQLPGIVGRGTARGRLRSSHQSPSQMRSCHHCPASQEGLCDPALQWLKGRVPHLQAHPLIAASLRRLLEGSSLCPKKTWVPLPHLLNRVCKAL